ncbi:MAG: Fe-S cluster assembly protein SufD [Chlamydiota bacterium]|nr:Fe-S cluster assembly protein SufD [Chlamydiota bacterium]
MSQTIAMKDTTKPYSKMFEAQRTPAQNMSWMKDLQQLAMQMFSQKGFPNTSLEQWRYTDLRTLAQTPFMLSKPDHRIEADKIPAWFTLDSSIQLIFINGHYYPNPSALGSLPEGLIITDMKDAINKFPDLLKQTLSKIDPDENQSLVALNTALFQNGACIVLPENTVLKKPIQIIYFSSTHDNSCLSFYRNIIILEKSSHAQIVTSHYGLNNQNPYCNNIATQIEVKDNASLDFYKVQHEDIRSYHISFTQAQLHQNSLYRSYNFDSGGALIRNDVHIKMQGSGSECILNGLYTGKDHQHIDNCTLIEHQQSHTKSRQVYKGILDDTSKGIFNGKIKVHEHAQKSDASQTNKNLLLSEHAIAHTRPQLEINTDDVKCSHGSTVGQLDKDALFYLCSRGLSHPSARSILTHGFANEILRLVKIDALRRRLDAILTPVLYASEHMKETHV